MSTESAAFTPTRRRRCARGWKPGSWPRNSGNVRATCRAAGVDRSTVTKARQQDPRFRAQWNEAMEDAIDTLQAIARQRDTTGQSDRLLEVLLRAHAPEFADRLKVDVCAEVRRVGAELGKSEAEIQAALREADLVLEEHRRRARHSLPEDANPRGAMLGEDDRHPARANGDPAPGP